MYGVNTVYVTARYTDLCIVETFTAESNGNALLNALLNISSSNIGLHQATWKYMQACCHRSSMTVKRSQDVSHYTAISCRQVDRLCCKSVMNVVRQPEPAQLTAGVESALNDVIMIDIQRGERCHVLSSRVSLTPSSRIYRFIDSTSPVAVTIAYWLYNIREWTVAGPAEISNS